ncbi:MAG: Holliday junction resolvase RuvX [Candidatus Daviesbacteria bacterium]|nr:Holliday junction resolvase RuvX [Candidatus Daviesbacteria bacterium]
MIYLGIDFGLKKLGFAISEGEIARPLDVIHVSNETDTLIKINEVIKKEGAQKIIMGIPESGIRKKILKVAKKLKDLYKLDIELFEETLSTIKAREKMIFLGIGRKKREDEDAYSAAWILQDYLDFKK